MEQWAAGGQFPHVLFACLNVCDPGEGLHVAQMFSSELRLKKVVNGYIERTRDMPSFGQLGCSGFILASPDGRVLVPATPPFLEYRNAAFDWITSKLRMLPGAQPISVRVMGKKRGEKERAGRLVSISGRSCQVEFNDGTREVIEVNRVIEEDEPSDDEEQEEKEGKAEESKPNENAGDPENLDNLELGSYDSVNVGSMDDDHEQCAAIIRVLARKRDVLTLKGLLRELQEHFKKEEEMMVKYTFGGSKGLGGHAADHAAILNSIGEEVKACEQESRNVKGSFIREVAGRLRKHIHDYDLLYSDFMQEVGAQ